MMTKYLKSFLNYPGGKYRILNQILPLFPNHCQKFIDLFTGSGVVTENYNHAKKYVVNDINVPLIKLQEYILKTGLNPFFTQIKQLITQFHLSDTSKYGYQYYHVNSSKGLSKINRVAYNRLRNMYNQHPISPLLYTLIIYGFNNQIRFNSKGDFNNPCGKRDWNNFMKRKLIGFYNNYKNKNITFLHCNFKDVPFSKYDFIYADPPYSITDAVYNNKNIWSAHDDKLLFRYLDKANQDGAKFALSNVLVSKGRKNKTLINWSKKYHIHYIKDSYNNSNYHTKKGRTVEVLITNY